MNKIKQIFLTVVLVLSFNHVLAAETSHGLKFPDGPDQKITPGDICRSGTKRYPEGISYCNRDVDSKLKNVIMDQYDHNLGFDTMEMPRGDFKIDHLIPLCAGGSNDQSNLWPQHKSVYAVTDPLEPLVCEKMAAGRLLQKDAIELIKKAKLDLNQAHNVLAYVKGL